MDRRQLRWSSAQETSAACFLHPGRKPDPLPSIVDIQAARIQTRRADGTDALPGNVAVYCLHRVHLTVESNVFIERLWRSVKYEEVYLKAYDDIRSARASLGNYFEFYNLERRHQSLDRQTPDQVYYDNVTRMAA